VSSSGDVGAVKRGMRLLLRLYTSTERLKRVYTSPGPLLEIDYFTQVMVLIIIYNFYSFYLKLT
jgi:hypothetical protein